MDKIGRYHIIDELGSGGMARVYRAHDPNFEREVAIKIMDAQPGMDDGTFRQRFKNEARLIASLEHSAIVPVYDFGEEKGRPYLVMRLMGGGTLADRLRRGPLWVNEAIELLEQIAPGLDEAHQKGIIHRDLKPGNILFDERGKPYIADFGLAKAMQQTTGDFTVTGSVLGTPAYMSPEQAMGDKALDGRSDIYALGVILFQMLTGKQPYKAETPVALALKHIQEPVPSLNLSHLPPIYDSVIARAMAKEPAERYPTASELVVALKRSAAKRGARIQNNQPDVERSVEQTFYLVDITGHRYQLASRPLSIGREPSNDIQIRDDQEVSRVHATIAIVNQEALVRDRGSSNGTFINEQPVSDEGMALRVGDRLRIGQTRFQLQVSSPSQPLSSAPRSADPVPNVLLSNTTAQHVSPEASEPQSRIANMTQAFTMNLSQKMESMSNAQVAALIAGMIGGFVLVTWLIGNFIRVNFPWLWWNLPLYYMAAPVVRAISRRKGTAFGVHVVLHMLILAFGASRPNYLLNFISALLGGAIFEGSFNKVIVAKIPGWVRFPVIIFMAYAINLLILGGSAFQIQIGVITTGLVGLLVYAIVESYKGYRQGRATSNQ